MEGWGPAIRSALTLGAVASGARRLPMITRLRAFWVLGGVVLAVVMVPMAVPGSDAGTPTALGYGLVTGACLVAAGGAWWMRRLPFVRGPGVADDGAALAFTVGRASLGAMLFAVVPYAIVGRLALQAPILMAILGPATLVMWAGAAPTNRRMRSLDGRLGGARTVEAVMLPWETVFSSRGRQRRRGPGS
jgi:hypothetical protein